MILGTIVKKFYKLYPIQAIRWIKIWKSIPISEWIKAANYFRNGEYRAAAQFYRNGLINHSKHPAAQCAALDLAYCEIKIGNIHDAEKLLSDLVCSNCKLPQVYLLLNQLYRYLGNNFAAVKVSSHGLQIFPGSVEIIAAHAHTCFCMPYFVSLIEESKALLDLYYRTGLGNEDEEHIIETAIADFECRYGDILEGEKILSRVLAAGNVPYEAMLLKGRLLIDSKRFDMARNVLLRAGRRTPDDPLPSAFIALSYLDEQEPCWALEHAKEACRLSGWTNIFCLKIYVEALKASGDESCVDLFEAKLDKLVLEEELQIRKLRVLSDPSLIAREIANLN